MTDDPFRPPFGLRHALIQSTLASKRPARRLWLRRGLDLQTRSTRHVLDCGDGVRLSGWHTPLTGRSRGLVVLIHGWEGSHESSYLHSMACALHQAHYAVFRLNLRDHGNSHDLNEAMFHSARMDEVLGALQAIARLDATPPVVVGFSLGGNFALRVGMQGPAIGVTPRLSIGISPAIHPRHTLEAIDQGPRLFQRYFLDKWRATMTLKSQAWPGRYDFSAQHRLVNFVEMTRQFVEDYTEYGSIEAYFERYTLTPSMLMQSASPLAIITAADDSLVPIRDFAGLSSSGSIMHYESTQRGGHCGFIENWRLESWVERRVLQLLEQIAR